MVTTDTQTTNIIIKKRMVTTATTHTRTTNLDGYVKVSVSGISRIDKEGSWQTGRYTALNSGTTHNDLGRVKHYKTDADYSKIVIGKHKEI